MKIRIAPILLTVALAWPLTLMLTYQRVLPAVRPTLRLDAELRPLIPWQHWDLNSAPTPPPAPKPADKVNKPCYGPVTVCPVLPY